MKKISLEFPRSLIRVGYTETLKNPADYMTKLFTNPSLIINSNLYRFGDPNMRIWKLILLQDAPNVNLNS